MAVDYEKYEDGWPGNAAKFCVPTAVFNRPNPMNAASCPGSERPEGFRSQSVTDSNYRWNLDP